MRVGERNRTVYAQISADDPFTISSATYKIYNCADNSVVISGAATVSDDVVYASWTPANTGVFVAEISYTVSGETCFSRQVIEVRETL